MKTRVAIACQGGGRHTAFTAFQPEFLANSDISQPVRIPKAFTAAPDKPYRTPWIEMSDEMQKSRDHEGKLDRRRTTSRP